MRLIYLCLGLLLTATSCAKRPNFEDVVCIQPGPTIVAPPPVLETPRQSHRNLTAKPIIMIDPGHGGKDHGAVTLTKPEYREKNLNLATARMVDTFLRQKGYRTVMTRSDDTFVSLEDRVTATKDAKAKLFVSIHYNSAPSTKAEGIEVFYYESDKDKDKERCKKSKALAQAALGKIIASTQASSRGVKHGNFAVIRNNTTPAILIEGGFITNDSELERIKDPAYIKKLAWGIAEGIDKYVTEEDKR